MPSHIKSGFENDLEPTEFYLSPNYPNPFRDRTTIKYCIPYESKVKLTVFNSKGEIIKKLVDEIKFAGTYEVEFNLQSADNSLVDTSYFYHLEADNYSNLKKMIFSK